MCYVWRLAVTWECRMDARRARSERGRVLLFVVHTARVAGVVGGLILQERSSQVALGTRGVGGRMGHSRARVEGVRTSSRTFRHARFGVGIPGGPT